MYFETPTDEAVHRFAAWNAALNTVQQRSLGGESLNCVARLTADVCMVGGEGRYSRQSKEAKVNLSIVFCNRSLHWTEYCGVDIAQCWLTNAATCDLTSKSSITCFICSQKHCYPVVS